MKKFSSKKLPKVVYVHIEEPNTENEFFMCNDNAQAAATLEGKRIVGIYKLEKLIEVDVEILQKEVIKELIR